jgi:hypothetical protein
VILNLPPAVRLYVATEPVDMRNYADAVVMQSLAVLLLRDGR